MPVRWGSGVTAALRGGCVPTDQLFLYCRGAPKATKLKSGFSNLRMPSAKLDNKKMFSAVIMRGSKFYAPAASPTSSASTVVIVKKPGMDCCKGNRSCLSSEVTDDEWVRCDIQELIVNVLTFEGCKFHARMPCYLRGCPRAAKCTWRTMG